VENSAATIHYLYRDTLLIANVKFKLRISFALIFWLG